MELICGACQGRLRVELPGTTVACPHCGTHLQTPGAEHAPQPQAPAPQVQGTVLIDSDEGPPSGPDPTRETVQMDIWAQFAAAQSAAVAAEPFAVASVDAAGEPAPAQPDALLHGAASGLTAVSDSAAADSPPDDPLLAGQAAFRAAETLPPPNRDLTGGTERSEAEAVFPTGEDADSRQKTAVVGPTVDVGNAGSDAPETTPALSTAAPSISVSASGHEASAGSPAIESGGLAAAAAGLASLHSEQNMGRRPGANAQSRKIASAGISPTIFMIVISYASAMTLACLYLAFQLLSNPRTHDLPDLAPPKPKDKKKVTTLIYLSPDQELPPANVLKLGESRQFGSLQVTPQRVTRGLLEFEYYEPEANQHKDPEGPVLKLHLRFENVSRDQEFVPLDSKLVFYKEIDRKTYGLFKANNFVCKVVDRKNLAKQVLAFDLTPDGNWLLKGENLDRELAPGQVIDTFIPTTPDQIESLSGDLVWRVHFRKGYNPTSYRGVTTLIEVLFKDSDIVDEEPPAPAKEVTEPVPKKPDAPAKEKPAAKDA